MALPELLVFGSKIFQRICHSRLKLYGKTIMFGCSRFQDSKLCGPSRQGGTVDRKPLPMLYQKTAVDSQRTFLGIQESTLACLQHLVHLISLPFFRSISWPAH